MGNSSHQLSYEEEVAQYTKNDAIHALLFGAYIVVFLTFLAIFDLSDVGRQITHIVSDMGFVTNML